SGLDDPRLEAEVGTSAWTDLREAAELLGGAGHTFAVEEFNRGRMIPVYFGSAINNFGVEPFLEAVLEYAPAPASRGGVDPASATPCRRAIRCSSSRSRASRPSTLQRCGRSR